MSPAGTGAVSPAGTGAVSPAGAAGLVLAAGAGRRLGGPKALVEIGGQTLLARACGGLARAGCAPVVAVLGAGAELVLARGDLGDAVVVVHPGWAEGMGSSLVAGLAALAEHAPGVDSTAVLLVDTPGIGVEAVRAVLAAAALDRAAAASYAGRRGHPVCLGRDLWPQAAALAHGDVGARALLAARPDLVTEVDCTGLADPDDLDTPAALQAWRDRHLR